MNNLTKAQVIALFLGSASAGTANRTAIKAILDGPSVCPSGYQCSDASAASYQALQQISNGSACTKNDDCSALHSEQRCALASEINSSTVDTVSMCVHKNWCGYDPDVTTNTFRQTAATYFTDSQLWATGASVPTAAGSSATSIDLGAFGKRAGNKFQLQCYTGTSSTTTPTAPANTAAITANFDAVKKVIDTDSGSGYSWDGYTNMFVSPQSNFQDGWWNQSGSNWIETDKPAIQHCGFSDQCPTNECCVQWPDTNNRRCKPSNFATPARQNHFLLGGIYVSRAQCEPANWAAFLASLSVTVTDASTTVDQQALDDAKRDVQDFLGSLRQDAATREGYYGTGANAWSTLAKNNWDTNYQTTVTTPKNNLHTQLETNAAISGLTLAQKKGFYEELLDWEKTYYNTCQTNASSIQCRQGDEIKKQEETARAAYTLNGTATNYYTLTSAQKATFNSDRTSTVQALETSLATAWLSSNAPTAGTAGASCANGAACNSGLCCGTSTPTTGQYVNPTQTNICASTGGSFTDQLGVAHSHTCYDGAKKLALGIAAAIAAISMM